MAYFTCEEHGGSLAACEKIHEIRYFAEMASRQDIVAARDWLFDCFGKPEVVSYGMTDQSIIRAVDRYFVGGWEGFLAAGQPIRLVL